MDRLYVEQDRMIQELRGGLGAAGGTRAVEDKY